MAGGSDRHPPFIGLTGGLGSGKSTVLALLEGLGAATLSTDAVVHDLYATPELVETLVSRWGPDVAPDGVVDRAAVARRVFGSAEELAWLEQLLWPLVAERVEQFRAHAAAQTPRPRAIVVETPLLFEAGMQDRHDLTVAVIAPDARREEWAAARGHDSVRQRSARQMPQEEKAARADHVVRNDGTVDELKEDLARLLEKIEDAQ